MTPDIILKSQNLDSFIWSWKEAQNFTSSVSNKIKAFGNFCVGRRMSNVCWKNCIFDIFDGFRLQMDGKVRPKNFERTHMHVKVCILKLNLHKSTQMTPQPPEKNSQNFYDAHRT